MDRRTAAPSRGAQGSGFVAGPDKRGYDAALKEMAYASNSCVAEAG